MPDRFSLAPWITAGAVALFLGTANPLFHVPLLIIAYPAVLYLLGLNSPRPFRHGWLTGILGSSACLYWIAVAIHDYGYLPWVAAVPGAVLLGAYVGLWGGLFAWYVRRTATLSPLRRVGGAAIMWFLLEWTRSWFLSGFPWLTLASGQAAWPTLIQGASLVGEYGLSAWLAGCGALLIEALGQNAATVKSKKTCMALACAALALIPAYGLWRLQNDELPEPSAKLTLVQGNMPQDVKWDAAHKQATVDRYLELSSRSMAEDRADLLIWPETAMPFVYHAAPELTERLALFAAERKVRLIFGVPDIVRQPGEKAQTYNRAVYLDQHGAYQGHYDKQHLVPFGEYIPPGFDNPLFASLLQEVGTFSPGRETTPFELPGPEGQVPLRLGMLICYEAVFPEIARQRVADGADVLINISNDAWYNRTSAPVQHLYLSLMRAVEQGRWMARCTNTGITAFVDPYGRISALGGVTDASGLFISGSLSHEVSAMSGYTPFHRLQPWLPVLAIALYMFILWPLARVRSRSGSDQLFS